MARLAARIVDSGCGRRDWICHLAAPQSDFAVGARATYGCSLAAADGFARLDPGAPLAAGYERRDFETAAEHCRGRCRRQPQHEHRRGWVEPYSTGSSDLEL